MSIDSSRVRRTTKLIGIVGNPLSHSLSPVIHNRAFEALNLDFVYLKFPTPDVKDFFENARAIGIEGFSRHDSAQNGGHSFPA